MGIRIYIAGPMRGHKFYNFPAFDRMRDDIIAAENCPVSPADLDRANGFDATKLPENFDWLNIPYGFDFAAAIKRDVAALLDCDAIVMLDGWQQSRGAQAELAIARWFGLGEYYETTPPQEPNDVLDIAARITRGDRQASYGPPDQDFRRTAEMWTALKGVQFEPFEVAQFMIALKLSRLRHSKKRDSVVDIAGYARCMDVCYTSDGGYQS